MRIAIDTGGTFTDCVYLRGAVPTVLKVLSTPADPGKSVLEAIRLILEHTGLRASGGDQVRHRFEVRHGTTIGTNALLERKGARVAFVTTEGFEDTIAIGRQARQHLYDWMATPAPCIVPAELRFGVRERVSAKGEILVSLSEPELVELLDKIRASGAESIAVSLLFSFANSENERRVAAVLGGKPELVATGVHARSYTISGLQSLNLPISISHEILPEFREYERAATVVVNAYLAPKAGEYVRRLESAIERERGGSLYVMQSSGGIVSGKIASQE